MSWINIADKTIETSDAIVLTPHDFQYMVVLFLNPYLYKKYGFHIPLIENMLKIAADKIPLSP